MIKWISTKVAAPDIGRKIYVADIGHSNMAESWGPVTAVLISDELIQEMEDDYRADGETFDPDMIELIVLDGEPLRNAEVLHLAEYAYWMYEPEFPGDLLARQQPEE